MNVRTTNVHCLDADKVYEIKRLLYVGETQLNIAEQFKISQTSVSAIKRGRMWRHVVYKPTNKDRKVRTRIRETFKGQVA